MRLTTRVFDLAPEYGFRSDGELARAMGVSQSYVTRVRNGDRAVTTAFVIGAKRAFPDKSFEDLFDYASDPDDPEPVTADSAA